MLRPTSDQGANSQRHAKGTEPLCCRFEKRIVGCCFGRSTLRPYTRGALFLEAAVPCFLGSADLALFADPRPLPPASNPDSTRRGRVWQTLFLAGVNRPERWQGRIYCASDHCSSCCFHVGGSRGLFERSTQGRANLGICDRGTSRRDWRTACRAATSRGAWPSRSASLCERRHSAGALDEHLPGAGASAGPRRR